MANSYFEHDNPLTRHTLGRAEQVNAIFQAVEAGFDKLPDASVLNEERSTYVTDTGTANAYVVAMPTTLLAYTEGLNIVMKAANTNTGASTINIDGLGVKTIKRFNGSMLLANDIVAGQLVLLGYDGTDFRLIGAHGAVETNSAASAQAAAASALAASNSASAAASSADDAEGHYDTFRGVYYGALASDPAQDPNGDSIDEGDWYYNTTTNNVRIYDGSAWGDLGSAIKTTFVFTAAGGETSLSGNDDNGLALAYTAGFLQLFKNGARLVDGEDFEATTGSTITGLAALSENDVVLIDAFSQIEITDPNSYEVTATGSSTARSLEDWFSDVAGSINVKGFGAVGDGVTDDTAAFQAAINFLSTPGLDEDDDRSGGKIIVPRGIYRITSTLTTSNRGIFFVGAGAGNIRQGNNFRAATILLIDHVAGPGVHIKHHACGLIDLMVKASSTREGSAAGDNYGVLLESEDVSTGNTAYAELRRVRVLKHPNHGIVQISSSGGTTYYQVVSDRNGGHGWVIDRGDYTSRVNQMPSGVCTMINCQGWYNKGHGLAVGHPSNTAVGAVRTTIINSEFSDNDCDLSVAHTNHQVYINSDNIIFSGGAVSGLSGTTGGFFVAGKSIDLINNRFLVIEAATAGLVEVGHYAATGTDGVYIRGMSIRNATGSIDPAVIADTSAKNITVIQDEETGSITSLLDVTTGDGRYAKLADSIQFSGSLITLGDEFGAKNGRVYAGGEIAPSSISGSKDNYNPTGVSTCAFIRQALSGAATLTGLHSGGSTVADGRQMTILNMSDTFSLTLSHESTSSDLDKRFSLPGSVDLVLGPRESVILRFTNNRWRAIGVAQA